MNDIISPRVLVCEPHIACNDDSIAGWVERILTAAMGREVAA